MMHRVGAGVRGSMGSGAMLLSAQHMTQRRASDNNNKNITSEAKTYSATSATSAPSSVVHSMRTTMHTLWARCQALPREWALHKDRQLDLRVAREAARQKEALFTSAASQSSNNASSTSGSSNSTVSEKKRLPVWADPQACPRSCLFVPGNNARAQQKIASLPADCFILDLEDSVGQGMKHDAREQIFKFVNEVDAGYTRALKEQALRKTSASGDVVAINKSVYRPRLVVRINSPDEDMRNAMLDLELIALLGPHIEGVAIPKTSLQTYDLIKDYVHPGHQLWAFFESAASILQARAICGSGHYKVAVMGYNDLAAELQLPLSTTSHIASHNETSTTSEQEQQQEQQQLAFVQRLPLLHAACEVLRCAYAHHMYALDGVYNDPTDRAGFARDVAQCHALGFGGKTLIHPSQIEPTNTIFMPSAAELEWAQRVSSAVAHAQGNVATVDGRMVEELHVRQAARMLARYESAQVARQGIRITPTKESGGVNQSSGEAEDKATRRTRREPPPSRHKPKE